MFVHDPMSCIAFKIHCAKNKSCLYTEVTRVVKDMQISVKMAH